MNNSNLPPDVQAWARDMEQRTAAARSRLSTVNTAAAQLNNSTRQSLAKSSAALDTATRQAAAQSLYATSSLSIALSPSVTSGTASDTISVPEGATLAVFDLTGYWRNIPATFPMPGSRAALYPTIGGTWIGDAQRPYDHIWGPWLGYFDVRGLTSLSVSWNASYPGTPSSDFPPILLESIFLFQYYPSVPDAM